MSNHKPAQMNSTLRDSIDQHYYELFGEYLDADFLDIIENTMSSSRDIDHAIESIYDLCDCGEISLGTRDAALGAIVLYSNKRRFKEEHDDY